MLELRPATGPYLEQILRDTYPLWNDELTPEHYAKYWAAQLKTAWGAAHLDRVALVESSEAPGAGRVLASAKRYDLSMQFDGRIRRVLGIGAVFTDPAQRGQGGASELLSQMLQRAEIDGFEFAMLFSEIGPAYYEKFDFVPVPLTESRILVDPKRGGSPAVLVRGADDRDILNIAEMNAVRSKDARLALHRDEDFIKYAVTKRRLLAGLRAPGTSHVEFLVTEEGHQAVAYLVCSVHGTRWFIEEAGDRDPSGARLGAMLQVMLAREPGLDPPDILAWWPRALRPPQVEILDAGPTREVLMLKPLADRTLPLPPLGAAEVAYWHGDLF